MESRGVVCIQNSHFCPGFDTDITRKVVILSGMKSKVEKPTVSEFLFRARQFSVGSRKLFEKKNPEIANCQKPYHAHLMHLSIIKYELMVRKFS